jgi:outer membrane lipoprotein-sorting protein
MRATLAMLALLLSGCAAEHLPTYPWVDQATALKRMSQRHAAWHSLSAAALITLRGKDGQSVRLDGAVVMAEGGRLRLRAWKFNQAVFDLTLTPQGLWVMTPQEPSRRSQVMPAAVGAAHLARALEIFTGDVADGATVDETSSRWLVLRTQTDKQHYKLCMVDRATLTPWRYDWVESPGSKVLFTLTLDHYREFGPVVWPMRIEADGPDGRITVELSDVEINTEPAAGAFVPPARAEKQP